MRDVRLKRDRVLLQDCTCQGWLVGVYLYSTNTAIAETSVVVKFQLMYHYRWHTMERIAYLRHATYRYRPAAGVLALPNLPKFNELCSGP